MIFKKYQPQNMDQAHFAKP